MMICLPVRQLASSSKTFLSLSQAEVQQGISFALELKQLNGRLSKCFLEDLYLLEGFVFFFPRIIAAAFQKMGIIWDL